MTATRRFALNTWRSGRAAPEQLLVPATPWGELDYLNLEGPNVKGEVTWTAGRTGTAYGLSLWFESELAAGVTFSNAPDNPELVYGGAFFPLTEPVAITEGDRIDVALRADFIAEEYVWSWNTRICAPTPSGEIKAEFKQSSFYALPIAPANLHKRAATYQPKLNEDGEIALLVLQSMKKKCTLEDIAKQVCERFPARFPHWTVALGHVGSFSGEYSVASTVGGDDEDTHGVSVSP